MKAIVTGAASGIGRAVAMRFASDAKARGGSAGLVLVDVNRDQLEAVATELEVMGAKAHLVVADLALPGTAQLTVQRAAAALGGLDALISNAGILMKNMALIDMSLEDYEHMFAINTRATWLLAQQAREMLRRTRGCIVATASISATEPTPTLGNYSTTKAALVMLVRQLAYELGPEGIRCNCVSPGTTRTGINDWILSDTSIRQAREANLPLRRVGAPADLAAAIAFLAGPDAAYITGADLLVDGGLGTTLMPAFATLGAVPVRTPD